MPFDVKKLAFSSFLVSIVVFCVFQDITSEIVGDDSLADEAFIVLDDDDDNDDVAEELKGDVIIERTWDEEMAGKDQSLVTDFSSVTEHLDGRTHDNDDDVFTTGIKDGCWSDVVLDTIDEADL